MVEKDPRVTKARILSGALLLITAIILVIIKINKPDFSTGWVVFIIVDILVICILIFFSNELANKLKQKNKEVEQKIPEAKELEELIEIVKSCLTNTTYRNHVKEIIHHDPRIVGKNKKTQVWEFRIKPLYGRGDWYFYINANFPKLTKLLINPSVYERNKAFNQISYDPEDPADEEERTETDLLTGKTTKYKKKTYKKKEKESKDNPKEGDIA